MTALPKATPTTETYEVQIPAGAILLDGELKVPQGASGIVLFAHGSGSSRHSPRNQYVARVIREAQQCGRHERPRLAEPPARKAAAAESVG